MIHLQIACPQSNWRKSYVLWINRFNVGYKVFLFKGKLLKFEKIFTDKSHEQMQGGVLWNTAYIFFFFVKFFIWTLKIFILSSFVTVLHSVESFPE